MGKCTKCGYENNDGAVYCLNCKTQLSKSDTSSDYDIYMQKQKEAETAQKSISRKAIRILIAILAIYIIGCAIYVILVKTAPSRAENLVCNYIESQVNNVESITISSTIGSCLSTTGYISNGFIIMGSVVISGNKMVLYAEVDMNGVFDPGQITSIKINYTEIYKK